MIQPKRKSTYSDTYIYTKMEHAFPFIIPEDKWKKIEKI